MLGWVVRRGLVSLGVVVALSASACGSSTQGVGSEEAVGTPSATSAAPASPSAPEGSASPSASEARNSLGSVRLAGQLKFGQAYDFKQDSKIDRTVAEQDGTVTVLEYRSNVAPNADRPQALYDFLDGRFSWSSLKVRVCHDGSEGEAADDDFVTISAWPWALELSDGSLASPFAEDLVGFPKPLYPTDDEELYAGACRTGHVAFAVPDGQSVARVLYIRQSALPVAWTDR